MNWDVVHGAHPFSIKYRASCQPPIRDTIVVHLNLVSIGIAIGAEIDLIKYHLDTAYLQCTTSIVFPLGLTYCELTAAHVHLREGDIPMATQKFTNCLSMSLELRNVEGICGCLEALQIVTPNDELAFRRVVTFLAIRMVAKHMLATVSALRLIGDLFAAIGDDATAAKSEMHDTPG
ncbi:hypothetical protein K438DRAFT_1974985 [Mycena galopus ATCC 62051]|nr:hypothetical protein K438DRAFT_1974985 [Mycena galopus ATCC 62051]